jgi:hypothetical protein
MPVTVSNRDQCRCINVGVHRAWVMEPVMKILTEVKKSMQQYRNIRPGEDFKGYDK